MFLENLQNIGKIENFRISGIFFSLLNNLFIFIIVGMFAEAQTVTNCLNFFLCLFYVLEMHSLRLTHPSKLNEFNRSESFRMKCEYNPRLIKIMSMILLIPSFCFFFFFTLNLLIDSIQMKKIFSWVNHLTFEIINLNIANGITLLLNNMIAYIVFKWNQNPIVYYDYYNLKIIKKFFTVFRSIILPVILVLIYCKKILEEFWSIINLIESIITIVFVFYLIIFYENRISYSFYKFFNIIKYFCLLKLIIFCINFWIIFIKEIKVMDFKG